MKSWKITAIASAAGTVVGLGAWLFGLGEMIWPAHPQLESFLLTLLTTVVLQLALPRVIATTRR